MNAGGLMGYVAIDMDNFRRWVTGAIGATGTQALNNNGYIIYFSDRRGDHNENLGDIETGEYGNEDSINPAAQVWAKTNLLETGENFNESGIEFQRQYSETLQTYGETPHALAVPAGAIANMLGAGVGFDAAMRPWTVIGPVRAGTEYRLAAASARPVLFRRALKVINGGMGQLHRPPASRSRAENPIYIQGNFNATSASVIAEPNVPAAIMAIRSRCCRPRSPTRRRSCSPTTRTTATPADTGYRFAMVTGKTVPFPKPAAWGVAELGSDGGVHNFMKMLEDWGGRTCAIAVRW